MAPEVPKPLVRRMFGLFREGNVSERSRRLAVCSFITWRAVTTTDQLSENDIRAVIGTLEYWKSSGHLVYRCGRIADRIAVADG